LSSAVDVALKEIDIQKPNPTSSYIIASKKNEQSETNHSMIFLAPFAIWARNIESREELFAALKLHVMFIHSHELVIESCYLYCYAIGLLIRGEERL
jgi:ADP-ribosylglycohydrolase